MVSGIIVAEGSSAFSVGRTFIPKRDKAPFLMRWMMRDPEGEGSSDELTGTVETLFREAYDDAFERYADPVGRVPNGARHSFASRVAWSQVKRAYERGDDGVWRPKRAPDARDESS